MKEAYLKSISMSGLFKYLDPQHYETVWTELGMSPRKYAAGQTIYGQDSPVSRIAIVHSGLIRGERLSPDGNSNVPYFYEPGELFAYEGALSGKKTSPLHITAEADAEVIFFELQHFFPFIRETDYVNAHQQDLLQPLSRGLLELLVNDDIKKLYRIEILSKKSLRERIMSYFHVLSGKSDNCDFMLNMTREQLASYLCVNRSALSHELNEMKRDGIIDFNGRKFRIVDRRF